MDLITLIVMAAVIYGIIGFFEQLRPKTPKRHPGSTSSRPSSQRHPQPQSRSSVDPGSRLSRIEVRPSPNSQSRQPHVMPEMINLGGPQSARKSQGMEGYQGIEGTQGVEGIQGVEGTEGVEGTPRWESARDVVRIQSTKNLMAAAERTLRQAGKTESLAEYRTVGKTSTAAFKGLAVDAQTLRDAVIWSEIIGKPRALRPFRSR